MKTIKEGSHNLGHSPSGKKPRFRPFPRGVRLSQQADCHVVRPTRTRQREKALRGVLSSWPASPATNTHNRHRNLQPHDMFEYLLDQALLIGFCWGSDVAGSRSKVSPLAVGRGGLYLPRPGPIATSSLAVGSPSCRQRLSGPDRKRNGVPLVPLLASQLDSNRPHWIMITRWNRVMVE